MGATSDAHSVKSNVDGVRRRKRVTGAALLAEVSWYAMRRRVMRGGGWAFLFGVSSAFTGCFAPDLGLAECAPCQEAQNFCLGELICHEGFCVRPGSNVSCLASGAGGEAGEGSQSGIGGEHESAGSPSAGGHAGAASSEGG